MRRGAAPAIAAALLAIAAGTVAAAPGSGERAAIEAVLDDWHDAAAAADFERYFGHFAPQAVFIGTDATERWTLEQFREFARPHFDRGKAWSFTPVERHVTVLGEVAWFDEKLDTPNLGPCRGSGVLVRTERGWKIAHYVLSVALPNAIVDDVVAIVAGRIPAPSRHPIGVQWMELDLRSGGAAEALRRYAPDVALLRSAAGRDLAVLESWRYERAGPAAAGEHAVLYDSERFALAPDAGAQPAGCLQLRLIDRGTGREFAVWAVGPAAAGSPPAERAAALQRDVEAAGVPAILAGDVPEPGSWRGFALVFPAAAEGPHPPLFVPEGTDVLSAVIVPSGDPPASRPLSVRLRIP